MAVATNKFDANKLYNDLKSVPKGKSLTTADIVALTKESKLDLKGAAPENVCVALNLMTRLAHEKDEKTFVDALDRGEFPPMKMSPKEMELVRGGVIGTLIGCAVAGLAAGLAIAYFTRSK